MSGRALHEQKSYNQTMIIKKINNLISFKCIYEIKDYNEIQIINYRGIKEINEEIKSKIKIINGDKIEDLFLVKKFNKIGLNTIEFMVKGKLTNMGFLFNGCSALKQIEFISFDTSQVTNMTAMFQGCDELEYINLSNFNTSNVTDIGFMFNECLKLKEIKGIDNFNTYKVTDMNTMFQQCNELEYLDLSNFNTSKVTDMSFMFNQCNKLKYLNLLNFTINCYTEDMLDFENKKNCQFITNNKDLLKLYNSS